MTANRVWKRVLQKQIDHVRFWRKIVVFEEGPSAYKVVQDYEMSRMTRNDGMRTSPQSLVDCFEWMYASKAAAIEQAEKCVKESERDAWLLSTSHR